MNTDTKYCSYQGISHAIVEGNSRAATILFIMSGIGASIRNYELHAQLLANSFKRIIIIDLPEQGSKGAWTIGNMVDQLGIIIDYYSESQYKFHLAGHSAGALAALSYVYNYDRKLEKLQLINNSEIAKLLAQSMLNQTNKKNERLSGLILYNAPMAFSHVMPISWMKTLDTLSENALSLMLNCLVNWPMKLISIILRLEYYPSNATSKLKAHYHNFYFVDVHRFLHYAIHYKTIFELFNKFEEGVRREFQQKQIKVPVLYQNAKLDWVSKFFLNKKTKEAMLREISPSSKVVYHKSLGHLLNHKWSLNINLNSQFLTNREVIEATLRFINENHEN